MNSSHLLQRLSVAKNLWLSAAWIGIVCGLLEAIQYLFFGSFWGQIPWELRWLGTSVEILWIAPVFDLALFLVLVTPLIAVAQFFRQSNLQVVVRLLLSWASFYNLLSLTGQLHHTTVLILSTGLTVAGYRWLRGRNLDGVAFMQKSFPYLTGLVILLVAATTIGADLLERTRIQQLPPANDDKPNVLLIVLDTLRADHVSAYGYSRATTPNLDEFATQGVLFENAIANSSWTVPSHASIMTGKYVSKHGAGIENPLDERLPTLSEELARHGYLTGGFVANTYWAGRRSGFARGFVHFEDYFGSVVDMCARTGFGRKIVRHILPRVGFNNLPGRKSAADINNTFLDWVRLNPGRPFFAFLNYMDVHDPYLAPPNYRNKFSTATDNGKLVNFLHNKSFVSKALSTEETKMVVDAYDSSLAYLDAELGSLFAALDKFGLSENTLVIITSDHGESFGRHGVFAHGNSLYMGQIRVPLIMRYPNKIPDKRRVSVPVGLNSIPATIMELVELHDSTLSGASLMSFVKPEAAQQNSIAILSEIARNKYAPASWPNHNGWLKSLVTSDWHLIIHEAGNVELYDVRNDPYETKNLSGLPDHKDVMEDLKRQLMEMVN